MDIIKKITHEHNARNKVRKKDDEQYEANKTYMAIESNTTLMPIWHLRIVMAKLIHALLDGGPSMLERACTVITMDWMWFHVVLVFMVPWVIFSQYSKPFCSIPHIRSMLVANQILTNKTSSKCVKVVPLGLIAFFLVRDVCPT